MTTRDTSHQTTKNGFSSADDQYDKDDDDCDDDDCDDEYDDDDNSRHK